VLYSTKFYTYVNELTFSIDNKFFGEYLNIYLLWTSFLMAFLFLFRFNVVSRFYLFIFTFLVPVILQIFRNTEVLSSLLGRSVTNESFITFNLSDDSVFRSLRIMTFRKDLGNYTFDIENEFNDIVEKIDALNKKNGEVKWKFKNEFPFRGNISIKDNYLFANDYNNNLLAFLENKLI